jgi:hypothetical protein
VWWLRILNGFGGFGTPDIEWLRIYELCDLVGVFRSGSTKINIVPSVLLLGGLEGEDFSRDVLVRGTIPVEVLQLSLGEGEYLSRRRGRRLGGTLGVGERWRRRWGFPGTRSPGTS